MSGPIDSAKEIAELRRETAALEAALAASQKSEKQLQSMLSAMPTLVYRSDADGAVEFFSQSWYDYTGLSAKEAMGDGWTRVVHPADLESLSQRWKDIVAAKKPTEVEALLRRHDGEYRWHLARSVPLFDDGGKLVGWCGTNTDIEDLKRAEMELRRSKAFLEHAQKLSLTGGVGIRVSDGKIFWSEETARIYGYDSEVRPTMKMVLERVHPDDVTLLKEVFSRAIQGGANFDFEHRLLMPDGTVKYIRNFARSTKDDAGREEVLGAVIDITEQNRAKAALENALAEVRASEEQLRTMLATIPSLAWRTSADGFAEFYSQRWLEYTGLSFEEAKGHGWTTAIHPNDRKMIFDQWVEIMALRKRGEVEARFRRHDGEYRWHLFQTEPLLDPRGEVINWYGTNTDIDDLKRADAFLEGEKKLFEMSATGQSLPAILEALCGIAEELADASLVAIRLLDDDGKCLRLAAAPNLPETFRKTIDEDWIGPAAGSCATAAFRGERVFVSDVTTDPLWADHRGQALEHGFLACFAIPIKAPDGRVTGTFAFYAREAREITAREIHIAEQFTHLASIVIERSRAEDALQRSEALLAEGQRISQTGSWTWCVSTDKIVWSEEHCRIFGFSGDQLKITLETFFQTVHATDVARVQAVLQDAACRACEFSVEFRINLSDGSMKHIHSRGRPVFGIAGQVEEFIGTAMDISHRYEAKIALENALAKATASEDQLRTLIDNIPGLAWTAGPNGEGEFFSKVWLDYTGMAYEEAEGPGWANAIHPDDVGQMVAIWQKVIATKKPGEQEARLRRFDGVYRWFSFRGAPLLDQWGHVVKWYGVNIDIDDLKRAEILLAGEKRLFEMIATGHGIAETLKALCLIVEDLAEGALVSILLLDEDTRRLHHGAAPSVPSGWLEAIEGGLIGPSVGSCGTAAYLAEKVFVTDIANDPLWTDYAELALSYGLRACFSTPIMSSEGKVLGTFAIYSKQARSVTSREALISEQFTHLASIVIERKRAEEALKNSEALLAGEKRLLEMIATGHSLSETLDALCHVVEELVDGSMVSVFLLDEDGKHLRSGAAPSLPKSYTDAIDGGLIGPTAGSCGAAAYRGKNVFVSDIATDPLWADYKELALAHDLRACFSTPVFSSDGKVLGAFGIYTRKPREITQRESRITDQFTHLASIIIERKRAEIALRESEATLAEGQRISHTGSWRWNPKTDLLVWSEECARIYGFGPDKRVIAYEELMARSHPDDRPRVEAERIRATQEDGAFNVEKRIVLPDGSIRVVQSIGDSVSDEAGIVIEYVGTVRDVTEQRKSEEEMRRLVALIENSSDCVGYAKSPQEVVYINAAWRKFAGLEADEDLAKYQMADFLPAEEYRRFLEEILPILGRDGHWQGERYLHNIKTQVAAPFHQTIFFITEADTDRRIGIATVCRNITESKLAEEELRKSEAALRKVEADLAHVSRLSTMGELTASIAHEVNQPLTGIVMGGNAGLRWLDGDSPNLDEARDAIQRVVHEGKRAGAVISRIRQLFKKEDPIQEPLNINETIEEVVVLTRNELQQHHIKQQISLATDLPPVFGDRVQIQQVLTNLILNAIEAMNAVEVGSRELSIRTFETDDEQVGVEVRDSGVGVKPQEAERIFETFHTTKPGGMGMGLAISRSIVQSHGGRLQVVPQRGPGATFRFTIPTSR